ncbi:CPBP family intramembrane metalloprotease [Cryobacterium sp. SO2]|uniref:CPBP family intramembrane glutamic endopeptidase n=1 Tax=Cryobacterium sp. SO2 TaxID=1897060 RepID=UPI00223E63BE|nr:CPBP family intramembrane glutamic endopeptidase [Cryobacterium sp. SO2]WEO77321.1 CPBP family intramembrane metalloprotease [Cryobacterium sp. SO2]
MPTSGRDGVVASVRSPLALKPTLVLLAALLLVTVVFFGAVVLGIMVVPGVREVAVPVLAGTLFGHAAVMLLVLHLGLRRAGSGWRAIGFHRPTPRILHLLWQVPVIFLLLAAVQGLAFALTGEVASSGDAVDSLLLGVGPLLAAASFIGIALLTPIWEEVVFRALVYGGFRRRFVPIAAALLSAALFAAFHGVPILLPYMLTLGLALAYLREFHTTLWAPIVMHVTLNALVTGVALLAL